MSVSKMSIKLLAFVLLVIVGATGLAQFMVHDDWNRTCSIEEKINGVEREFFCLSDHLNYLVKIGSFSEMQDELFASYLNFYNGRRIMASDIHRFSLLKNELANREDYQSFFDQQKDALFNGHHFFMGHTFLESDKKKHDSIDFFLLGIPGLVLLAKKHDQKEILAFLLDIFGNDNLRKFAMQVSTSIPRKVVPLDFGHQYFFEKHFFEKIKYRSKNLNKDEITSIKRFLRRKYIFSATNDLKNRVDRLLALGFPPYDIVDGDGNNLLTYFNDKISYFYVKQLYVSRDLDTRHLNHTCAKNLLGFLQADELRLLRDCHYDPELIIPSDNITMYEYLWKNHQYNLFYSYYNKIKKYPTIAQNEVKRDAAIISLTRALGNSVLDQETQQEVYTRLKKINYGQGSPSHDAAIALKNFESKNMVSASDSSEFLSIPLELRQHNFLRVDHRGRGYIGKIHPQGMFRERKVLQLERCGIWQRFFSKSHCDASFVNYQQGSLFYTKESLYAFSDDQKTGNFVKNVAGTISAVVALPFYILVSHGDKLTLFNYKLEVISSTPAPCRNIVKMIYNDEMIYILGEKSIAIMKLYVHALSLVQKIDYDIPQLYLFDLDIKVDSKLKRTGFVTLSEYRYPGMVAKTYDGRNLQGDLTSSRLIAYNRDVKMRFTRRGESPALFVEENGEGRLAGVDSVITFPTKIKKSGTSSYSLFSHYVSIADQNNFCVFDNNALYQPIWCGVR